ncbi:hypothetical protein OG292_15595 [Streptomyces sp. NBC_01511]|uniref:hypothetical protein n=1 Tax=Streptomyces sp. NBC_01511 TaxID=2903889 RepID=UPI00386B1275
MTDEDPLIHPHTLLTAPDGQQVNIDVAMVPVIKALWEMGMTTTACCQNVGEATAAVRDRKGVEGGYRGEDFIAYHMDWALVKMPRVDAVRLIDLLTRVPTFKEFIQQRWTATSWRMNVPLIHEEGKITLAEDALLHFPSEQIPALAQVLAGINREETY